MKMIRCPKTRTYTREKLKLAVQKVLTEKVSVRSVAQQFRVPRMTLQRYLHKAKVTNIDQVNFDCEKRDHQIFDESDEMLLRDFFLYASNINHGLSSKEGRRFVYEYAVAKELKVSARWRLTKMAPSDWFYTFMKKHNLSLQSVEEVDSSKQNLSEEATGFFDKLKHILQRYHAKALQVFIQNGTRPINKSMLKIIAQDVK